jgi:metal-dependent amidase/aminoacylase/carboxypeptidase family protein
LVSAAIESSSSSRLPKRRRINGINDLQSRKTLTQLRDTAGKLKVIFEIAAEVEALKTTADLTGAARNFYQTVVKGVQFCYNMHCGEGTPEEKIAAFTAKWGENFSHSKFKCKVGRECCK